MSWVCPEGHKIWGLAEWKNGCAECEVHRLVKELDLSKAETSAARHANVVANAYAEQLEKAGAALRDELNQHSDNYPDSAYKALKAWDKLVT